MIKQSRHICYVEISNTLFVLLFDVILKHFQQRFGILWTRHQPHETQTEVPLFLKVDVLVEQCTVICVSKELVECIRVVVILIDCLLRLYQVLVVLRLVFVDFQSSAYYFEQNVSYSGLVCMIRVLQFRQVQICEVLVVVEENLPNQPPDVFF